MPAVGSRTLTHNQNREKICLICFTKPKESNRRKIQTGPFLTRIKAYFMENYDPNNQYIIFRINAHFTSLFLSNIASPTPGIEPGPTA